MMKNDTQQKVTSIIQMSDDEIRYRELSEIGLSDREAKVYLTLIKNPGVTAGAVPDLAAIPRNKVYETLRGLWQLGFVEQKVVGGKKIYTAIEPDAAIPRVLENNRVREKERQERGRQLTAKLNPIFLAGRAATRELAYMSFLKNPELIRRRLIELQKGVHYEILVFSKGPYMLSPQENTFELEALDRGVKVRAIYEINEAISRELQETIQHYGAAGEQARVHPELPVKLAIFDRRTVLMCMRDPGSTQLSMITLVIEHPDLALILCKSFEQYWSESIEWRRFLEQDGGVVYADNRLRDSQV